MPDQVSVVILNYNTRGLLLKCLNSIQAHAPESEVIVVDNASTDDSVSAVRREFPAVALITHSANHGFARGMNAGIQAATAPALLALNADTELLPTTLPPLLRALSLLPRAGLVGPAQYLPGEQPLGRAGPHLASAFSDPTLLNEAWRLLLWRDALAARFKRGPWRRPAGPPRPVDWLMGAALLFRRECWNDVMGFDESEFMYGEDWDICYRARQAGWRVYLVPEAQIIHHANAAGQAQFGARRLERVLQANLHFHEKHFGRASRQALTYLYLIGASQRLALLLPGWLTHAANPTFQARWQAHRAEVGAALNELRRRQVPLPQT